MTSTPSSVAPWLELDEELAAVLDLECAARDRGAVVQCQDRAVLNVNFTAVASRHVDIVERAVAGDVERAVTFERDVAVDHIAAGKHDERPATVGVDMTALVVDLGVEEISTTPPFFASILPSLSTVLDLKRILEFATLGEDQAGRHAFSSAVIGDLRCRRA